MSPDWKPQVVVSGMCEQEKRCCGAKWLQATFNCVSTHCSRLSTNCTFPDCFTRSTLCRHSGQVIKSIFILNLILSAWTVKQTNKFSPTLFVVTWWSKVFEYCNSTDFSFFFYIKSNTLLPSNICNIKSCVWIFNYWSVIFCHNGFSG